MPTPAPCKRLGPPGASGVLVVALLAACSAPAPPPAPVSAVTVAPFETVGPVDLPDFVGAAVAESLERRLETVADLRVLDAPAADEQGVVTLQGTYTREPERTCVEVRARAADRVEPLWTVERCSIYSSIGDLVGDVTRACIEALGHEPSAAYPYIGRVEGGEEMATSPQLASARDRLREGDFAGFSEAALELVERFPSDPAAHVMRAWSLTLTWDGSPSAEGLSALRDELDVLKRVDPNNPYDDTLRAFVYRASGAPEQARSLYTRVADRGDLTPPARSWVLRQRSFAHAQIGENEQAVSDSEEAVRLDPSNPQALVASSRALEVVGDLDGALTRALQAVALEPTSWRHLQRVGIVATRARSFDQAVDFLGRACDNGGMQEACGNLAVALQRAGRNEQAREVAERAAERPASRWGSYNMACLWALRGETEAALASLREAIELGFADVLITTDPDLDSLRADRRFDTEVEKVLGRIRARRNIATTIFPWQG